MFVFCFFNFCEYFLGALIGSKEEGRCRRQKLPLTMANRSENKVGFGGGEQQQICYIME
ncbi:hypothetical protein AAZV13_02G184800 [Glycine max]